MDLKNSNDFELRNYYSRGGALPYIRNSETYIRNSETGYDYLFKNNRLLFSRTIAYGFPYCFWNLIIPKRNTNFFLNGLWRVLKNGYLPVKLHSSVTRGFYCTTVWKLFSKIFIRSQKMHHVELNSGTSKSSK